ncbi:RNA polymerase sigma factor [Lentzea sp. NPDC051213]|uniref:RNA polymerase sigma factor n=1 Tax=Lentzea sp. NPDC051213 TaxID=3364126 RepID=UPI0037A957BE
MTGGSTGTRMGELLEAARSGHRASLDELVRELTPLLWHVARAQGIDRSSASDVVQNTWLKLLTSWDDIRSPQALVSWLITVAKRDAWRMRRSHAPEDLVDGETFEGLVDQLPTPEERVVAESANRELWATIDLLPVRCRQLLRIMAFTPRPNYAEISAELGVPRGTIGPTRGRCMAKLRTLLAEEGGEGDERR